MTFTTVFVATFCIIPYLLLWNVKKKQNSFFEINKTRPFTVNWVNQQDPGLCCNLKAWLTCGYWLWLYVCASMVSLHLSNMWNLITCRHKQWRSCEHQRMWHVCSSAVMDWNSFQAFRNAPRNTCIDFMTRKSLAVDVFGFMVWCECVSFTILSVICEECLVWFHLPVWRTWPLSQNKQLDG